MKKYTAFLSFLLIMIVSSEAAESAKGKLKTFLLMGQSNMAGWGDYSSLDPEWAKNLETTERIYFCSKDTKWQVSGLTFNRRSTDKPYTVKGTFGPEYSFIDEVSKNNPGDELLFFKHAVGGTSLYAAWDKEWTPEKADAVNETMDVKVRLYAELLERIKIAEEFARTKGYDGLDILAVTWVQGESDAAREVSAKPYKDNLKKFINNLRADLPDPDFKFICFQVNSMESKFIEEVRTAQEEVAAELDGVFLVPSSPQKDPDDFPKYDRVHYNAAGLLNIGRALAGKVCE